MKRLDPMHGRPAPLRFAFLVSAILLAAFLVACGTFIFLSKGLPDKVENALNYPVANFNFVFGSGNLDGNLRQVDQYADGYALLSSGPIKFKAAGYRVLRYTWVPAQFAQEAAFFWRRADQPQTVSRIEITTPGSQLLDLSTEPQWAGEIIEIGFLLAGENDKPVGIGDASLFPDSLKTRLQLTWQAWTAPEERSQKSINFLYGGDSRQLVSLPLLVSAWLVITLVTLCLIDRFRTSIGSQKLMITTFMLFLCAWGLLDIRWAVDNLEQIDFSLGTRWQLEEPQKLSNGLDGEIYAYVQYLKSAILNDKNARILIIGDENAEYYLQRAKYHLLPHSVNVARGFAKNLMPEALDFVIYFGETSNIVNVNGWTQTWQESLVKADSGEWGTVFQLKK